MVILSFALITFSYGGATALYPAFSTDLYGFKYSGANFGLIIIGTSFGALLCPYILAFFQKLMPANPYLAFYMSTVGAVAAVVLITLIGPLKAKRTLAAGKESN